MGNDHAKRIAQQLMFGSTPLSQMSLSGLPSAAPPRSEGLLSKLGTGFVDTAPNTPDALGGLLGFGVRPNLYPGEDSFFKSNPTVGGMAAETGDVILNPYSGQEVNHGAVARNEALRLLMRDKGVTPDYELTPEQRAPFAGTPYGKDDAALKSSIAARIYSGDPSARATDTQKQWVDMFLNNQFLKR